MDECSILGNQYTRFSPLQRPLFFRKLHDFAVHKHAFAVPDSVHIPLGNIGPVRLFPKVFQLLISGGHPEWILIQQFVPCADRSQDFWNSRI